MAPSRTKLAEFLNEITKEGQVALTETRDGISVYQLSGAQAAQVISLFDSADWHSIVVSDEGGELSVETLSDELESVQVTAQRVPLPEGIEAVLTAAGMDRLLGREPSAKRVWVEGLTEVIETETVQYAPWGTNHQFDARNDVVDPAKVVRFLRTGEGPRGNLGRFLLRRPEQKSDCATMAVWKTHATRRLLTALSQEVEPDGQLLFRGPPPARFSNILTDELADKDFRSLQEAGRWVYENERDVESRHTLFSAEIARTTLRPGNLNDLAHSLSLSLEGAKIAYGFNLTQQSRDTLKALTDLRKAITEETSKLSDTTRSLCAAVVGSIFANIGLLIARATVPLNGVYVASAAFIMSVVLALYVLAVICSGIQYISIQRQLRLEWRYKIYRFLGDVEYQAMVEKPVRRAEKSFYVVCVIGTIMAVLCLGAVYEITRVT